MTAADATLPHPVAKPCEHLVQLARITGRIIPIARDQTLIIGSDPHCGLTLSDPYVSFRHAAIRRDGTGFRIEDLGSTNGTYLDGVRIEHAWAGIGSRIRLGNERLDIVSDERSPPSETMLGQSLRFRTLVRHLRILARVRPTVLIRGETGTGKEMAARALHDWGPRANARFIAVNCASLSDALVESTLFGHRRGAFTGALRDQNGAFLEADGGTLFLDEIGELPLAEQAKLLRVLETGHIRPVGSPHEHPVDVRIVAATHRDLAQMVARGFFREDLFHRLAVLEIHLPALRDRREDIPLLLEHFCQRAGAELERRVHVTAAAVEAARAFSWPGNVRALRNAVLRAATFADGPIGPAELLNPFAISGDGAMAAYDAPASTGIVRIPRGDYASMRHAMLAQSVAEHGSIRKAAEVLRIPRSTLSAWLRRSPPSMDPSESV